MLCLGPIETGANYPFTGPNLGHGLLTATAKLKQMAKIKTLQPSPNVKVQVMGK